MSPKRIRPPRTRAEVQQVTDALAVPPSILAYGTDAEVVQMNARAALREVIERSKISQRRFAEDVLVRDGSTVEKWLAGVNPIPRVVRQWLARRVDGQ